MLHTLLSESELQFGLSSTCPFSNRPCEIRSSDTRGDLIKLEVEISYELTQLKSVVSLYRPMHSSSSPSLSNTEESISSENKS